MYDSSTWTLLIGNGEGVKAGKIAYSTNRVKIVKLGKIF